MKVSTLGVKQFRKMLRNPQPNKFEVFQLVTLNTVRTVKEDKSRTLSDPKLERLLDKYGSVLRQELPPGLPPIRAVDHEIDFDKDSKPPHRPLYQLSKGELKAAKEYVDSLLTSGKIRPSRSPYGAPLFFCEK